MKNTRAFTIGAGIASCFILCLLLALLLGEKHKQERSQCASRLRQIGQAMGMYVADNDGYLPSQGQWLRGSIPGLPQNGCPIAEEIPPLTPPLPNPRQLLRGYAFNTNLTGRTVVANGRLQSTSLAFKELQYPRTTIAVFDYTSGISSAARLDFYKTMGSSWPKQLRQGWKRHDGGGNYLFCDGHVQWLKESQLLVTEPEFCDGNKSLPHFCLERSDGHGPYGARKEKYPTINAPGFVRGVIVPRL